MSDRNLKKPQHRCIGVDHGAKRVGLAVSDPLWIFAQPLGTYAPNAAIDQLKKLDARDGVAVAVVGWPLMPDGSEGRATDSVASFIKRLKRAIPLVAVVKWDERYTSEVARERIREAGPRSRWKGTKGRIDTAAASIILQEYLDERAARHRSTPAPDKQD